MGAFKHTTVVVDTTGFIYLDLISPQYVGRALVRCMRTFIYPSLSGQHVFDNVYYLPVEKRTFKSIRRGTLQLTGKTFEFKCSTAPYKMVLYFRRVSTWEYKIDSSSSLPYVLYLWIHSPGGTRQTRRQRTHSRGSTRGHGFGSILTEQWRMVRPVLWSGTKNLG